MQFLSNFLFTTLLAYGYGAKILAVYPFPSYSHYKLGDRIFKELANKGHEVTVITPYKEKNLPNNFNVVSLDGMLENAKAMKSSLYDTIFDNIIVKTLWIDKVGITFTELTLNHTNVQKFLRKKQHFDLVIMHQFVSDAYTGFCYHYKAPCVAITSSPVPSWINRKIGNPGPPSYVSQVNVHYLSNMNFFQRFYNTYVYVLLELSHYLYYRPKQNDLLQKYFLNAPHLDELYYNVSLILVNSHVSVNDVAPFLPTLIHIGGAHVDEPKPLSTDLQNYLDEAKDGVIYFSMGSNLKSADLPEDTRNLFLKVFAKLKQKVLWKWEEENLPNKSSNVKIGSWLPQRDILSHPNIVLFITHGGLMSTIEAVYNGVPILGIPVFADQGLNAQGAEKSGYGKCIFYRDLNENNFEESLQELLTNPKYRDNAKKRSAIMHDEPTKPLEKAIFWIEYVLRHNGTAHLRSAALNLSWYQYHSLDVILVVILIFIVSILLLKLMLKKLFSIFYSKEKEKST